MRVVEALKPPSTVRFVRSILPVDPDGSWQHKGGAVTRAEPPPSSSTQSAPAESTGAAWGVPPRDLHPAAHYWRGASGRLYRHSAHTAVFCPAPQRGVYVLARRDTVGRLVPLFVGAAANGAATLNLARIRERAATLGATEVHLCPQPVSGSIFGLRRVVRDIRAGL